MSARPLRSNYANILAEKRIAYMPTCIIVEMMTRLYSQVSTVNLTGSMLYVAPDLLVMLRRLGANLRTTVEAYNEKRVRHFIGDWRQDKLRARKLFFNIMSRLGYITELLSPVEKKVIYQAVEKLAEDWKQLDLLMENGKANKGVRTGNCDGCMRFRSEDGDCWQNIMADRLLLLKQEARPEPDEHLILLCYKKVKNLLAKAAGREDRLEKLDSQLSSDDIVVISNEDLDITCPLCSEMSDSLRRGYSDVIHRQYRRSGGSRDKTRPAAMRANVRSTRRHVMPPSLVGISTPKR